MAALIAASVALGTFEDDFAPKFEDYVSDLEKYKDYVFDESIDEKIDKRMREIRGPTSSVIAITAVAIMLEAAVILTRFLNIGFVNANIKTLLCAVSLTCSYLT